ncbi:hypothetical protein BO86DRAFT_412011 [Aspergillus japonicus CBS 114.51]|uniref:C2H2-type domain-containing protein n=1 Tax=Aspergillus japonicus CBS 114.51 TaxID=1448312 RepID=A0A8T8WSN1_ASPJA|nr:hypothetical protein BO86DRAFT_412011 [Aspergillus japonicus CBS 114.51]RAH78827.1 hypothetical protein BO86DRAFT_412011 [Aspergillus japonicus CBS 114.51]
MSVLGGARPHCQRVFKSLGLLRRHHRVMHGPNTQTCALCGRFFFGREIGEVEGEVVVKKEEEEEVKMEDIKMEVEEAVKKEEEEEDVKTEVEEQDIKEEEMELEEGKIREEMDLDAEAFIQTADDAAPPSQFYHPVYGCYRPMCSEETFDMIEGKDIQPAWP